MSTLPSFRLRVMHVAVLAILASPVTACSRPTATLCPRALARLVSDAVPGLEVVGLTDVTLSVDWTSASYLAQVQAMATRAVVEGAAFRVVVFAESLAGTETVLFCPTVAPRVNDAAGRKTATQRVERVLHEALRERFADLAGPGRATKTGRQIPGVPGTDLYGGFRAVADTPLVTARRLVLCLTDGAHNTGPADRPPRLDQTAVSVFGIGRRRGHAPSTERVLARVSALDSWLRRTGADPVSVSTQPHTFGGAP